jgi:hypothetical protein
MTQSSLPSDVFKFVALRPPTPPTPQAKDTSFICDDREPFETPVGQFLSQFNAENASTINEKLQAFIKENKYDLQYPQSQGDTDLQACLTAAKSVPPSQAKTPELISAVEQAVGKKVKDLYTSDAATRTRNQLWDRYYAFYVLSLFGSQNLEHLTTNLRTFHLLRLLTQNANIANADILNANRKQIIHQSTESEGGATLATQG